MKWAFWKTDQQSKTSKKQKQLEDTAKAVTTIIESGYSSHHRIYRVNFIRGLFFGLGSALGATMLLTVVAWGLSFFETIPIVGGLVETLRNSTQNR